MPDEPPSRCRQRGSALVIWRPVLWSERFVPWSVMVREHTRHNGDLAPEAGQVLVLDVKVRHVDGCVLWDGTEKTQEFRGFVSAASLGTV